MPVRVLVGEKADDPPFLHHAEHLAHIVLVDDVHADETAVLVDETIHCRIPLAHGDADDRKARLRQGAAHELPVSRVPRGDDCALPLRKNLPQMLCSLDLDIICHMVHDDGKAQNLEEHGAETHGALLGDPLRFLLIRPETHGDLRDSELLPACRKERPERERQDAAEGVAETSGQTAGDKAQEAHQVVSHPFASLSSSARSSCFTFLTSSGRRFIAACMRSHS